MLMERVGAAQSVKRVLSIDGGGIRGIIPARVVAHLERKAKKPASELFDLMVGTSTGGMLALGLSLEGDDGATLFNAHKMVKLYEAHGGEIFEQSPRRASCSRTSLSHC